MQLRARQLAPTICRQALVRDALARAQDPTDAIFMLHREMLAELRRELAYRQGEWTRIAARERKLAKEGVAGARALWHHAAEQLQSVEIAIGFVADLQASGAR